jgi:hypothetical protein
MLASGDPCSYGYRITDLPGRILFPVAQMSLRDTLDECWRQAAPEVRAAYDGLVRDLAGSDLIANALKAGDRLPTFELPNVEGKFVSSEDLAEHGPVVVSFFRGGSRGVARRERRRLLLAWLILTRTTCLSEDWRVAPCR